MSDLVRIGSETAKGGFANEKVIAQKFRDWKTDKEARKWLEIMNYNIKEINSVEAYIIHGHKTDVQIKVIVKLKKGFSIENLSIKKANKGASFNQVDKRWVDHYKKIWNIPNDIAILLKQFTGEISPRQMLKEQKITKSKFDSLRDNRRFFLDELEKKDVNKIVGFFKDNKLLVIADLIKGNDEYAADWMLVTLYDKEKDKTTWALADINKALSVFGNGDIRISPRGSLYIGQILMQRKGGDGGRESANMLQFKINPSLLFDD
ncbi:MAG: hypothetical protein ACP5U0_10180, partial [Caldisphaera sp.]